MTHDEFEAGWLKPLEEARLQYMEGYITAAEWYVRVFALLLEHPIHKSNDTEPT